MNWFSFFFFSSNRWDCRTWHYLILLMSGELFRLSCHLVCRQLIITTRNHVYFIFLFFPIFKKTLSVLLRETETMGFFIYQSWWASESRAHAHSTRKKVYFFFYLSTGSGGWHHQSVDRANWIPVATVALRGHHAGPACCGSARALSSSRLILHSRQKHRTFFTHR
jgi:hypothetical protein